MTIEPRLVMRDSTTARAAPAASARETRTARKVTISFPSKRFSLLQPGRTALMG
jgi:hypothetical protein